MRNAFRFTAVLAFLATLLVIAPPAPAEAAGRYYETRIVTHNIAGGLKFAGGPEALSAVEQKIDTLRPHIVAMQEVCVSQFREFERRHPDWTTAYAITREANPDCNGENLLTVLATPGEMSNRQVVNLEGDLPDQREGRETQAACATVWLQDGRGFSIRACTTHMPTTTGDPSGLQYPMAVDKLVEHLTPFKSGSNGVALMGDMNAAPDEDKIAPLLNMLKDSTGPEPTAARKIDYILRHDLGSHNWSSETERLNGSDHRIVSMRVSRWVAS